MTRYAHLVGAWPGRGPEHAMQVALSRLGSHLLRLTDGETGDRHLWTTLAIDSFRANPDVEMVRDGDWTDYDKLARFRRRRGHQLDPDNIRLRYGQAFASSYPAFRELCRRHGLPGIRFQVGIPAPIDVAGSSFPDDVQEDPSILDACTEATAREILRVAQQVDPERVVFQIESVFSLVAVAQAQPESLEAEARRVAAQLRDLVTRVPAATHFGVHLCLGDFHHNAYGTMSTVRPLVALANAIADDWPAEYALDYIHGPFAAGRQPPASNPVFYEPLRALRLAPDTRFAAGFVHETLALDAHRRLLATIEDCAGREVDISAACGLGRRDSDDEAWAQMDATARLLDAVNGDHQ